MSSPEELPEAFRRARAADEPFWQGQETVNLLFFRHPGGRVAEADASWTPVNWKLNLAPFEHHGGKLLLIKSMRNYSARANLLGGSRRYRIPKNNEKREMRDFYGSIVIFFDFLRFT